MRYLTLAAALAALSASAMAGPIVSGDGSETRNGGACVTLQPHPAWHLPALGRWISYTDTGVGVLRTLRK